MVIKYCYIAIEFEEPVNSVVLQIEMKKPKNGPFKEPTDAEVAKIVAAYCKATKLTAKKTNWKTGYNFSALLH